MTDRQTEIQTGRVTALRILPLTNFASDLQ